MTPHARHLQTPRTLAVALALASGTAKAAPVVLYDGTLGTLPSSQGWNYAALDAVDLFSVETTTQLVDGGVRLDSLGGGSVGERQDRAGWSRTSPITLDRNPGFQVSFTFQLLAESHVSNDRAGWSLTVLGNDQRGVEIGFWTNEIWAQTDSPLFTHASGSESAAFNTTAARVQYDLVVQGDSYSLAAGGNPLLNGPIKDYTAFTGLIDPYETPNFIFIGDNTSSAATTAELAAIVVTAIPEPNSAAWLAGAALGATLALRSRRTHPRPSR